MSNVFRFSYSLSDKNVLYNLKFILHGLPCTHTSHYKTNSRRFVTNTRTFVTKTASSLQNSQTQGLKSFHQIQTSEHFMIVLMK